MLLFEAFPAAFIRLFGSDGALYMEFAVRCLRSYLLLILFTCVQKGMCNLSAVHRSCTGSSAGGSYPGSVFDPVFSAYACFCRCDRYFLGSTGGR